MNFDVQVVGLNRPSNEVPSMDKPCNGISTTPSAPKHTPPPPPPVPGPPAPPPCAPAPPPTLPAVRTEIKNVPKPSNPLKSFNWSKLPDAKVNGTVWTELDDTKLYQSLELENIDKLFCAYQKAGTNVSFHCSDQIESKKIFRLLQFKLSNGLSMEN